MSTLPDERQTLILDRLLRDGRVMATDLATELRTSEDTIRRDLRDLAAAGRCRRVYGGALPLSPAFAPMVLITPSRSARMMFCIFIASRTQMT